MKITVTAATSPVAQPSGVAFSRIEFELSRVDGTGETAFSMVDAPPYVAGFDVDPGQYAVVIVSRDTRGRAIGEMTRHFEVDAGGTVI
ncbi:hypothetical protein [Paraburkholderia tuberum]|uniref:Uncharacterized protein n=1 Tax=Paraburkholderia tuberum TaxID=157910 RepID=A0A1H1JSC6_9BURK|nr:hypothetical protein [Paraburkholderia tuberum]SDR52848.1 hypothetical protein SAMN05445850_5557 [Paraburkholderia tuberum]